MTPADIDAIALRARAEAEAVALRAKAEVDAVAVRAVAESEAAAARARAEIEAHALRIGAEADRDEAARLLAETRHQVEQMLREAQARIDAQTAAAADAAVADAASAPAPVEAPRRSVADRETLDRLQATRIHLHDAIERLAEMSEPVLDLTDGLPGSTTFPVAAGGLDDDPVLDDRLVRTLEQSDAGEGVADAPRPGTDATDPVDAFVLAAIERAASSGVGVAEPDLWGGDHPSTRRRELRDGRDLL
jgi:hypothetical protein